MGFIGVFKSDEGSELPVSPQISVVIPTASNLPSLEKLVSALSSFAESPHLREVVIVINGPNASRYADSTLARDWTSRGLVRVIAEPVGSLLAGRHRGVFETTGDVVSFLDDDVIPSSSWLSGVVEAFEDPGVVLAGGPSIPLFATKPPSWLRKLDAAKGRDVQIIPFYSLLDLGPEVVCPIDPNLIWGLNFSIRRRTLIELGGFHPDLAPQAPMFQGDGETGLTMKIAANGLTAGYFPKIQVTHVIPQARMNKDYLWKRGVYGGIVLEFGALRRATLSEGPPPRPAGIKSCIRRIVRRVEELVHPLVPKKIATRFVTLLLWKSQMEGRLFLRKDYKSSTVLREWIARESYWDFNHFA